MIERVESEKRVAVVFPRDDLTRVAAASLALPLVGVSRSAAILAPLVAACWANTVAAAARARGVDCKAQPFVTADLAGVTVEVLRSDRRALADLPAWLLTDGSGGVPRLPDEATLRLLRARSRSGLSENERASDAIRRGLFGIAHRYAIAYDERVACLRDAGLAEVAAASAQLSRGRAVLAVGLGPHASESETGPPDGSPLSAPPEDGGVRARQFAYRISRAAGGERALYCVGTPGVALGSPWKFPLHVAWALLSGRDGLLDRRLRHDRALTYSLGAFSRELAEGGYGVCFAECRAEAVEEVAAEVRSAFAELIRGGLEPAVVRSARERLVIQQLAAVQAERDVAERLCSYEIAGVDPLQYAAYPARIAAVTEEQVCAAAAAFLRFDS